MENNTIPEVAKILNVCHTVISKNLKNHNIHKENKNVFLEKDILEDLYTKQFLSIRNIAKKLKVNEMFVRKSLYFYEIKRRAREWKSEHNKTGKYVSCKFCGKSIYRKKSRINKFSIFFCSWECEKEYQSITRRSWLEEGWRSRREYKKWRRIVLKRDHYRCKLCDSRINPVAHHIKEAQQAKNLRYDISNGITLCEKCHIKIHQNGSENYIESLQEVIFVENLNIGENLAIDNSEATN